jgi:GT2 family glycosyltransferase
LVVDNAPPDGSTRRVVTDLGRSWPSLDYVVEPRPGASRARNLGVERAANEVILFIDDDVEVDGTWAGALSSVFEDDPAVRCATGLVVPAELATQAQVWFEQFGGFGKGFIRRKFDLGPWRSEDALYPFVPGMFGSGNNAAVMRSTFLRLGGFDPCLGPGTPTKAGEDLDLFLRFLHAGWRILYEPSAIAWHHHRREVDALERQVRDYGVGLSALFTKWLLKGPPYTTDIVLHAPAAARAVLSSGSSKNAGKGHDYPTRLTRTEIAGLLRGPMAYLRARAARQT